MEIDLVQNKPKEEVYELRIVDTCFDNVQEEIDVLNQEGELVKEVRDIVKVFGTNVRFKTYTYQELRQLGQTLNLDTSNFPSSIDYINELFKQGLLFITQQECQEGISGEGKGMYFSEAQDWVII